MDKRGFERCVPEGIHARWARGVSVAGGKPTEVLVGVYEEESDPFIHGSDDREKIDVFLSLAGLMGFPGLGGIPAPSLWCSDGISHDMCVPWEPSWQWR